MSGPRLVPCGVKTYRIDGSETTIAFFVIHAPGHPADRANVSCLLDSDPHAALAETLAAFEARPPSSWFDAQAAAA